MTSLTKIDIEYSIWLTDLKKRVRKAQVKAIISVNSEMIMLYWQIGRDILDRQTKHGWGAKIVNQLSKDLKREFPGMTGFSPSNLNYMLSFARAWPDKSIFQAALGKLTWYHHVALLTNLKDYSERLWYAAEAVNNGWSRNVMVAQIDTQLHLRKGAAVTNFKTTLPAPQSELVQQTFKDPYIFDFLTIAHDAKERDVELGLIDHISKFMLELGKGFAYLGRQYPLQVGGQDYFLDLLFYNVNLHCFVIIDLKIDDFKPEYAGKMQFYLNVLDDAHKSPIEAPPIGIILCRGKNNVIVEYALKDSTMPLGVATYTVTQTPPPEIKAIMPTIEEFEREMDEAKALIGNLDNSIPPPLSGTKFGK
jgi:predicted nuclease of restriction endonuclease-like (RecB) superfamily